MNIHQINAICPLCSTVTMIGHTDMTGQETKYICPRCSARHYGEPDVKHIGKLKRKNYVCGKCSEESQVKEWKTIPMSEGEPVLGPMQSCKKCNAQLEEGKIAFIETEDGTTGEEGRTGRLFFLKPHKKFLESIGDQRAVYIEKAVLKKMLKEK